MEIKRVKGRFVRQGLDGDGGAKPKPTEVAKSESSETGAAPPRPRYCRTFTRARIAEALPNIVKKFTEEAAKGSIAHTKLLVKIGGLDTGDITPKGTKRRGKSVIRLLLENLKDESVEQPVPEPTVTVHPEAEQGDAVGGAES